MLSAFANTLKIPELRTRLLFTFGLLAICRVFAAVPVPGINGGALALFFEKTAQQAGGGLLGLYSLFTGGALENCAIAAMGIMPYISASIILQLLVAVVPQLGRIAREENGRQKLSQYTRYVTVGLAIFQGYLMVYGFFEHPSTILRGFQGNLVTDAWLRHPFIYRLIAVSNLTAGTVLLMWLGEQITQRGVGNGISLIITANIVARLPAAIERTWQMFFPGEGLDSKYNFIHFLGMIAILFAVIAAIIAVTQAQRKITVQYAKRMVGQRMVAGGQTYMPLRVNYSGVMPIIFAQAILMFPQKIFQLLGAQTGALGTFFAHLSELFSETRGSATYYTIYSLMIFIFSFFWVATTFNEIQIADDLKKYGGYVPGMRPGKPTADFLHATMTRITLAGALFLTIIALIPQVMYAQLGIDYLVASFFGGTSMLIVVGVMLDTMRQVETHLLTRHYDGFLKKGHLRGRR
ncbi:MAG: preprotein translocase subunit SecY [Verrucomicrobiia bacterium]|jgi:preprotein translocase subunit SecY